MYLFKVMGLSFIIAIFVPFFYKRRDKIIFSIASLTLILFAITVSLTPDVTVNHKYIILSIGLLNIFIADLYLSFWDKIKKIRLVGPAVSILSFLLVIFLGFSLFATGFVELIGYKNKNANTFNIDLDSPVIQWLKSNTEKDDVFLTAPFSMNVFFFSGRKVFYGWPYYTMTAGHDTASRFEIVKDLFSGCGNDLENFEKIAFENNIAYVIIDETLLNDPGYIVDTLFFETHLKEVVSFPQIDNTIIYKLAH